MKDLKQRTRRLLAATRQDVAPFILDIHYAGRFPSVSKAYALDIDGDIEGIVTYGKPASATLRIGLAGPDMAEHVLELNRLCLKGNARNDASWLVAASLKALAGDYIVISYADISQGHMGTVYQACNFLYTGLSAKRTDWAVRGKEHLHGQTIADEFRGHKNRSKLMREKYGDDFYLKPRSRKHRYVFITGSRSFKRDAISSIKYELQAFPRKFEAGKVV